MRIEFNDRYTAAGMAYPDLATVCSGHCEGMGVVPVHVERETAPALVGAVVAAMETGAIPDEAGYIFVVCPACKGTGRRA